MFRLHVWDLIQERERELVSNVQGRQAPLSREVKTILSAPWVHTAAEQFVGGIVDVLGKCVIRPEIDSASEAMDEIDGPGMIYAAADRWECGDASEETVPREWKRIEVVKALQRARRAHNHCRHVTRIDKSGKRRDAPAWNIRVKSRRRIQPLLNRQFQAARTHITHFDAAVTEQFVLYAQRPGDDLWRHMIGNERSGCRSSVRLGHRRNVYLQQSAELQESLPSRWIGWIGGVESSAPLRCTSQRARQAGVLFRLQLWRQTVYGKVVWHDIIRQAGAP